MPSEIAMEKSEILRKKLQKKEIFKKETKNQKLRNLWMTPNPIYLCMIMVKEF